MLPEVGTTARHTLLSQFRYNCPARQSRRAWELGSVRSFIDNSAATLAVGSCSQATVVVSDALSVVAQLCAVPARLVAVAGWPAVVLALARLPVAAE